ncbi:ferredoxin [Sinosporangium siamense]|uniref:Ferredoxin n=1 Tax=Sinosporangium siamense TaxID=1367973 RepID=A0A919RP26_9ACTN|nr:ferredoxin [Sinosporangium siamense]GII96410.1 ferredoxin [Sinosporangium siamense]
MRISVDPDRCVGAGQCVLSAPEVFDQDADGIVTVVNARPADDEAVRHAGELCPSGSITLHED